MKRYRYVKRWYRKWYCTLDYIAVCPRCLWLVEPERKRDLALGGGWAMWEHEHPLTFIVLKESVDMETREPRREFEVEGEIQGIEEVVDTAKAYWEEGSAVEEVESTVWALLSYLEFESEVASGEGSSEVS